MSNKNVDLPKWEDTFELPSWDDTSPIDSLSTDILNQESVDTLQQEPANTETLIEENPISLSTVEGPNDILHNELNNPGSSLSALANIANPDFESNQKINSSDYGLFQINDKYWSDTSNQLFNKNIADQSIEENIEMAAYIAKNDPRGWNNWVAYNKQKHKEFDGITDEEIVNKYGVSPEAVQLINESFDDPQTAKQVMLAESGGKQDAINVNYTPQEEGNEVIGNDIIKQAQKIMQDSESMFAPSTSRVIDPIEKSTQEILSQNAIAPQIQQMSQFFLEGLTGQYSGLYDMPEFKDLKPVVNTATNFLSYLLEAPGIAIDLPTSLATEPIETAKGLIKFVPEQSFNALLATNSIDVLFPILEATNLDQVLAPVLSLMGVDFTREGIKKAKIKAEKEIQKTGGAYVFFAAHGLTSMGKKNANITEKNKQFADVVELANDRPAKGKVTPEMQKAAKSLKESPSLKKKAEQAVGEQLEIDFIEPKKVEKILEKAEKEVITELDLSRDIPTKILDKKNNVKKEVKKVEKKVKEITEKVKREKAKKTLQESIKKQDQKKSQKNQEILQEQKITKSSDFKIKDGFESIKGEPTKRYKSLDKVKEYVFSKLPEYVGKNVIATYAKTTKGDYLVRMLKVKKDAPKEIIAAKSGQKKIGPDVPSELVTAMRDPRGGKRRIQNREVLLEKYSAEINELNRNLKSTRKELSALEKQTKETGVGSQRIELLKNSIDSITRTMDVSQKNIAQIMTTKELIKDSAKLIFTKTSSGQIGGKIKKSSKQKSMDSQLSRNIQEIWKRGETGAKLTKNNLIKRLKEEGAPKEMLAYASKNYKDLADRAFVQNAFELSKEIDASIPTSQGAVTSTKTKRRNPDEYVDNIRVEVIGGKTPDNQKLAMVQLLESLSEYGGGERSVKAKGTRSIVEIKKGSQEIGILKEVISEISGQKKLAVDALSEKTGAGLDIMFGLMERLNKTANKKDLNNVMLAMDFVKAYISEPARNTRYIRELMADKLPAFEKYRNNLADYPDFLAMLDDLTKMAKEGDRSKLHMIAELGRNMKLATGSSLVRSLAGNSISTLDAFIRMPIEWGYSHILAGGSGLINNLTYGKFGNLSRNQLNKLELSAQVNGFLEPYRNGQVGKLMLDMLLEQDSAIKESKYFRREGFTNLDIPGKTGVAIRTFQRLQGMIDIMFRVPMTNAFMKKNAVRQAIEREGLTNQLDIKRRAIDILDREMLSPDLLENAIKGGEAVTFQSKIEGPLNFVNTIRLRQDYLGALSQLVIPFYNTSMNLLKYTYEHTPLNLAPFTRATRNAYKDAFSPTGQGPRALAENLGKVTTGAASLYVLNQVFGKESGGKINGDWSQLTPEERNMKTVMGEQEYSIELNDGSVVSYRGYEPISSYITLIHSYHRTNEQFNKDAKKGKISDTDANRIYQQTYNGTKEMLLSFAENPFFTGVGDIFKAFDNRHDFESWAIRTVAGTFIPGFSRQIDSIIDPVRRKALKKRDIDENNTFSDYIKSNVEKNLPWFTEGKTNLPALDAFGNEIPKLDPVGGLYAFRRSDKKDDPVYAEIQRLFFDQEENFTSARPVLYGKEQAQINLTREEHQALIKISGQTTYNIIDALLKDDNFQGKTDFKKRKEIREIKSTIQGYVRNKLFKEQYKPLLNNLFSAMYTDEVTTEEERIEFVKDLKKQLPSYTKKQLQDMFKEKYKDDRKYANDLIKPAYDKTITILD